jgi:hypothetical protein
LERKVGQNTKKMKMNSKQINFYLTQDDISKFDNYIKENNLLLIGKPSPEKKILFADSLLSEYSGIHKLRGHKYIVRPEDVDLVTLKFIENQNHYVVDVMNSPVVEIWCSNITNESKKPDRIYYIKDALLKNPSRTIPKSPEFLKMADDLFRWIRKNFKNANLPGFERDIVSPAIAEWVQSGGRLIRN